MVKETDHGRYMSEASAQPPDAHRIDDSITPGIQLSSDKVNNMEISRAGSRFLSADLGTTWARDPDLEQPCLGREIYCKRDAMERERLAVERRSRVTRTDSFKVRKER